MLRTNDPSFKTMSSQCLGEKKARHLIDALKENTQLRSLKFTNCPFNSTVESQTARNLAQVIGESGVVSLTLPLFMSPTAVFLDELRKVSNLKDIELVFYSLDHPFRDGMMSFIQETRVKSLRLVLKASVPSDQFAKQALEKELQEAFSCSKVETLCIEDLSPEYWLGKVILSALIKSSLPSRLTGLELQRTNFGDLHSAFSQVIMKSTIKNLTIDGCKGDVRKIAIDCSRPGSSVRRFVIRQTLPADAVEQVVMGSCQHLELILSYRDRLGDFARLTELIRRDDCKLNSLAITCSGNAPESKYQAFCLALRDSPCLQQCHIIAGYDGFKQLLPPAIEANERLVGVTLRLWNANHEKRLAEDFQQQVEPILYHRRMTQLAGLSDDAEKVRIWPKVLQTLADPKYEKERYCLFRKIHLVSKIDIAKEIGE